MTTNLSMHAESNTESAKPSALICKTPVFFLVASIFSLLLNFSATAEDKAIIVFDASGSMWGQLEGKTKIEIAKKTLSDVVTNWNEEKQLGLLAYGHRKKGDCSDIETLVPVGKINKTSMISKVNKINPKGKTPISASIKMAANELKFTEDDATVILISDGKETCNADPCETAAELEKLGVNFTAHVIGFGVDKTTTKQLQCIADNTGGKYFGANNAKQLNDAFKKVVEQPKKLTLRAIDEETGVNFKGKVEWTITNQATNEVINLPSNYGQKTLPIITENTKEALENALNKGDWVVSASARFKSGEKSVKITGEHNQTVKVMLVKQLPKVTINAPKEAIAGTFIDISWDAPAKLNGKIKLQSADEKPTGHGSPFIITKEKLDGTMRLPSKEGLYKLYFFDRADYKTILTEVEITLTPANIVINAPETATTGTKLDISWQTPQYTKGKINLQLANEKPKYHISSSVFTHNKTEGTLRLPSTPGEYLLRFYNLNDQRAVTEKPITLVEESIVINAPDSAVTGTEITISWDAPKAVRGRINLQAADEKPKFHSNPHKYTENKSESTLRMPSIPGDYVLRWFNLNDRKVIVERPITLTKAKISINAPEEAGSGTEIDISWDSPKSADAKINLEPVGTKPKYHSNPHIYTKNKKEASMRLPSDAGDYILRWYNISDRKVVIEKNIKLTEQTISINAPDEAGAGSEIDVSWEAPKSADAKINIEPQGEKPKYHSAAKIYTKKKSEASVRLPSEEGDYVLRYYNISDRKILAEKPIKVIAQQININAPEEAIAGTEIELSWDAPKGLNSFINIQLADEKPNYNSRHYIDTRKKQSDYIRLPSTDGNYVLRWWNRNDRQFLAEKSITLKSAKITINAAESAIAGTEIEVSWEAPEGLDSFINIQMSDEKPNYNVRRYLYTKKKSSDWLRLPSIAGDYKLRWWNKNTQKPATEKAITLTKPDITIITPENGIEGSDIEISWEAPKGLDSLINIQAADERPNYHARNYVYTKRKNSAYLKIPQKAGEYKIRWWNKGDDKPIHEQDFTIITGE